jgi:hypothetical protein
METDALRESFLEYLRSTFGEGFTQRLETPADVRAGERVLYKLVDGIEATRREPTSEDLAAMRRTITDIARHTGPDPRRVTFEPPISSGLPFPRLLDLPGLIMWDTDLTRDINSDDALPATGCAVQWALGVTFMPSERMLLYLDFSHPVVKAIFRASYDAEDGSLAGGRAGVRERFTEFQNRVRDAKGEAARRPELVWVKLIRLDDEPLVVRSKMR